MIKANRSLEDSIKGDDDYQESTTQQLSTANRNQRKNLAFADNLQQTSTQESSRGIGTSKYNLDDSIFRSRYSQSNDMISLNFKMNLQK